jgi:hypothetical protein
MSIQKIPSKNLNASALKVIEQKNKILDSLIIDSQKDERYELFDLCDDKTAAYMNDEMFDKWPEFIQYRTATVFDIFEKKFGDKEKFQEACLKAWKFDDKNQLILSDDPVIGFAEYIIKGSLGLSAYSLENNKFSDYETWLSTQSH